MSPVLTLRAGAAAGKEKVRVWDVAANRQGSLLASASGDGAVRLWSLPPSDQLLEGVVLPALPGGKGGCVAWVTPRLDLDVIRRSTSMHEEMCPCDTQDNTPV